MSYAELSELELRIARLKTEKQNAARDAPRRQGKGEGEGAIPRSQKSRQYLGRPRSHAAVVGGGNQGWQEKQGRLPNLDCNVAAVLLPTCNRVPAKAESNGVRAYSWAAPITPEPSPLQAETSAPADLLAAVV
jgi:hypothetical protein